MRKNKRIIAFVIACIFLALSLLSGCQSRKKFDSQESMILDVKGSYSGLGEHSGERIVIDGTNIIKFNIDNIFPEITDENFFWDNFSNEDWTNFNISALLNKNYIEVITEPISINIKKSTISSLMVTKSGELLTQDGYLLNKTSSDYTYPTTEMQQKFEEFSNRLKKYEKSIIVAEAESNFSTKQESLNSSLSSATSSNSTYRKSSASAETIAECAFDSLKDHMKYPRTASLDSYSTSPQYDDYGRVATLIVVTSQNGFGNYITEDIYVVLQSCTSSGSYTYKKAGMHYTKTESYFRYLMIANSWDTDPDSDSAKETPYNEAIELIKNKDYLSAIDKLDLLGDYKSSVKLKEACQNFIIATEYKNAIDLFSSGKYAEASEALTSLLAEFNTEYLKAERVISLCNMANIKTDDNTSNLSSNISSDDDKTSSVTTSSANSSNNTSSNNKENSGSNKNSDTTSNKTSSYKSSSNKTGSAGKETLNSNKNSNTSSSLKSSGYSSSSKKESSSSNKISSATPKPSSSTQSTSKPTVAKNPCANGHTWEEATCTTPATCSVCKKTSGIALSHEIDVTKCFNCEHTDFSKIAKTYTDISSYDLTTGEDFDVQNVSISSSGVFSFIFNGEKYNLKLVQKTHSKGSYERMVQFDCYVNGTKEPDALVEVDTDYYIPRLEWKYLQGHNFYIFAE